MELLSRRIRLSKISAVSKFIDTDYSSEWQCNVWRVTLRRKGRQMTVTYRMGLGLSGEPQVQDVVSSIWLNTSGYLSASGFEDWAAEYGYDTGDFLKREETRMTYRQIEKQAERFRRFLQDDYEAWMYHTECNI